MNNISTEVCPIILAIQFGFSPAESIFRFCDGYGKLDYRVPLVVVPTTYNLVKEERFIEAGVSVIIYANHLLRSSYKAMKQTAETILEAKRGWESETTCYPVQEFFKVTNP